MGNIFPRPCLPLRFGRGCVGSVNETRVDFPSDDVA